MRRFRALGAVSTVAIALLLVLRVRGQSIVSPRTMIGAFGPPAIESGRSPDLSRAPDSPETRQRLTLRGVSTPAERIDSTGRRYVAGRVIVKFREGASAAAR